MALTTTAFWMRSWYTGLEEYSILQKRFDCNSDLRGSMLTDSMAHSPAGLYVVARALLEHVGFPYFTNNKITTKANTVRFL